MTVEITSLYPTPSGLVGGAVIRYGKGGPVRFVKIRIPWKLWTREVRVATTDWLNKVGDAEPEEDLEPLF